MDKARLDLTEENILIPDSNEFILIPDSNEFMHQSN